MIPVSFLLVLAIGTLPLFLLAQGIYNVFFHPLRHYPGPLWAKVNRVGFTYYGWKGELVWKIKQLHDQYGEVVRVAPSELSYINAQAWQDIAAHRTKAGQGNLPKELSKRRPSPNSTPSIISANDEDHRRMRRLQSHMFSEKALLAQEPLITAYVDKLISSLRERAGRVGKKTAVDLVKWYNFTTFDILGDLAFGESFGCLKTDAMHPWIANIFRSVKDGIYFRLARSFPSPIFEILRALQPQGLKIAGHEEFSFASQKARDRMEQGVTRRADFTSYILKYNDGKGMTPAEIESNASLLIIAGSETTATALSGITYHLLRTPLVLKKLTTLIRDTFPTESDITSTNVQRLEYFTACLEEGFRMYPPVPSGLVRTTTQEGNMICNQYVPPNTNVYVTQFAAYNSTRNFADSNTFVPERWMKNPPRRYNDDNKKVMQAFSVGPRNCIGRNLAYTEMRLIFARMLWNFDMELQPESQTWMSQKIYGLWDKPPLMATLSLRET